jgi:hypothetical protein
MRPIGKSGFRQVMASLINIADFLADAIVSMSDGERFLLMSKTHGNGLSLCLPMSMSSKGAFLLS